MCLGGRVDFSRRFYGFCLSLVCVCVCLRVWFRRGLEEVKEDSYEEVKEEFKEEVKGEVKREVKEEVTDEVKEDRLGFRWRARNVERVQVEVEL